MRVSPDELVAAAQRLTIMQSDTGAANLAASASTTRIAAAAQDEVSGSLATLFSTYGQRFHANIEQARVIGVEQFAQRLTSAASSYSGVETSNSAILSQFEEFLAPLVTLAQTNPLELAVLLAVGPFALAAGAAADLIFFAAIFIAHFVFNAPYAYI